MYAQGQFILQNSAAECSLEEQAFKAWFTITRLTLLSIPYCVFAVTKIKENDKKIANKHVKVVNQSILLCDWQLTPNTRRQELLDQE